MASPTAAPASSPVVGQLAEAFRARRWSLYVVGGSVRDWLRGRPTADLDFTTNARPDEVKRLVRRAGADSLYTVGEKFGTIGAVFGQTIVEITTYRSEQYEAGSRKPDVEFGDSLLGDLSRRDFTINAMAKDAATGEIVDPFDGRADLDAKILRAVGDPAERFAEDPLRLLRAIRFAVQLAFQIEPRTRRAIAEQADALAQISRERIVQEMNKILVSRLAGLGIRVLCELGLMRHIVPEVLTMRGMAQDRYHHKDVFEHTLQVIDRAPSTVTVRWAALLHDIAKPRTRRVENGEVHFFGHERIGAQMARTILTDLRLDRQTIEKVSLLVEMHQRANSYEPDWTAGAVRRFMREAGDSIDDLLALSDADVTTRRPEKQRAAAERVRALQQRVATIRAQEDVAKIASPLDGNELMALFGRPPGPWIKPIKERLLAAVLDGELAADDKEGAAELARELIRHIEDNF